MSAVPARPRIYHIVHVDRLPSITKDGHLWCDVEIERRQSPGTTIGMDHIKARRLSAGLASRPGLHVGDCVPFYFCPRSVMLYVISRANHPDLDYCGGQGSIVHLEADAQAVVAWAEANQRRWAFTLSGAGSRYFEDRCDLTALQELDWHAIRETFWKACREQKQAEFLVEHSFPWNLVERVGVISEEVQRQVDAAAAGSQHQPVTQVIKGWYY
jgi:hypothetical protein